MHLVEADSGWSKRSKGSMPLNLVPLTPVSQNLVVLGLAVYLGKKRAGRCTFTCARLEAMPLLEADSTDLVWIQWTLQYLTDKDAVRALVGLAHGLSKHGVLIVKENRPYGAARGDRFQLETPTGEEGRYDITRTDAHHRVLFAMAGLRVHAHQVGVETNAYVLAPAGQE